MLSITSGGNFSKSSMLIIMFSLLISTGSRHPADTGTNACVSLMLEVCSELYQSLVVELYAVKFSDQPHSKRDTRTIRKCCIYGQHLNLAFQACLSP
ncbi:TPA: hypothetical protein JH909_002083 [Acinetobacter baumannii]|nr:hypothetical protein [Acinetobacter baumannii]